MGCAASAGGKRRHPTRFGGRQGGDGGGWGRRLAGQLPSLGRSGCAGVTGVGGSGSRGRVEDMGGRSCPTRFGRAAHPVGDDRLAAGPPTLRGWRCQTGAATKNIRRQENCLRASSRGGGWSGGRKEWSKGLRSSRCCEPTAVVRGRAPGRGTPSGHVREQKDGGGEVQTDWERVRTGYLVRRPYRHRPMRPGLARRPLRAND